VAGETLPLDEDSPGFAMVEAVGTVGAAAEGCSMGALPPGGGSDEEETEGGEEEGDSFSSLSTSIASSER